MLNTNKNLTVQNLPNNRAKKLAWMKESVWSWHIIFTDHMANIIPIYIPTILTFVLNISLGANDHNQESVPPTGATTNAK